MTVLVTGGAGFIGSHVVDRLVEQGTSVAVLDDLSSGRRENLPPDGPGLRFVRGCVTDADAVARALVGVRSVIHLAGLVSAHLSCQRPDETFRVNVGGTRTVLDGAAAAGVQRFVFVSTCAVYGTVSSLPLREDGPLEPASPYAESKLQAEAAVMAHGAGAGPERVVLRLFNVYGPRQEWAPGYAAAIPEFARRIRAGREIDVHGDGLQTRDFCHVHDVVRAVLGACVAADAAGRVINVGTGTRTSVLELVAALGRHLGVAPTIRHAPPRPGDPLHSVADVRRARELLGFTAGTGLDEGLADTLGG